MNRANLNGNRNYAYIWHPVCDILWVEAEKNTATNSIRDFKIKRSNLLQ